MSVEISVVIPTRHRPALLAHCLDALAAQTLDPQRFEVIVVDDGPCEQTREVVESRSARPVEPGSGVVRMRYVARGSVRGPAAARNRGWRGARAPVIAFTDDDCIPDAAWLEAGLRALATGADGAGGRLVVPRRDPPTDYEAMIARLEHAPFVTANSFYRRAALERVGGFDERFPTAWREDSDLHFSLLAAGSRLVEAFDAVVAHPVRPAPWGVSIRDQRKSQFNALLYRKHPALYRRHIQAGPPWRYLGIVASLVLALAAGAAGARRVAALAGAAWFAQTLAFAAYRLSGTSRRPGHVFEMLVTSAAIPPLSVFWRAFGAVRYRVAFL